MCMKEMKIHTLYDDLFSYCHIHKNVKQIIKRSISDETVSQFWFFVDCCTPQLPELINYEYNDLGNTTPVYVPLCP